MWSAARIVLGACAAIAVLLGGTAASATPAASGRALLPDLDQEFPSELQVISDGLRVAPMYRLGFRSAVRNIGRGPLVISGHRAAESSTMSADQLIELED